MGIIRKLENFIQFSSLSNVRIFHVLRYYLNRRYMSSIAQKYDCDLSKHPKTAKLMKEAMIKYHWYFDEFFMYGFENLSYQERHQIVTQYEKNIFCKKVNGSLEVKTFADKWETYLVFKEYYRRKVFYITKKEDLGNQELKLFLDKTSHVIVKPTDSSWGAGIKLIKSINLYSLDVDSLLYPYIIEEKIEQNSEMAKFHPKSVNTIRITTIKCKESTKIIHPFMKIGRGNNVVDNGGCGGILCAINPESGIIISACDELLHEFIYHPDTNEKIIGFKIPKWQEAIDMALKLSERIPSTRYVGWDLALTDQGWVMVEGNERGQFVGWQLTLHRGFRDEFDEICSQL